LHNADLVHLDGNFSSIRQTNAHAFYQPDVDLKTEL
jgi:hypothetical protein